MHGWLHFMLMWMKFMMWMKCNAWMAAFHAYVDEIHDVDEMQCLDGCIFLSR